MEKGPKKTKEELEKQEQEQLDILKKATETAEVLLKRKENPVKNKESKAPKETPKEGAEKTVISEIFWDNGNPRMKEMSDGTEEYYNEDGNLDWKKMSDGTEEYYNEDGSIWFITMLHDGNKEYYDKDGNLESKTMPDGTEEYYYKDGNLKSKTMPDGTEEYYYKDGNLDWKKMSDGTREYYYKDGNLKSKTMSDGTRESYDKDGNLKNKTMPDGTVEYYNKDGSIWFITMLDGTRESYNENGNLESKTMSDGTRENYKLVEKSMEELSLTEDDFKNIPEWQMLSASQKVFVIEESSQEILSKVRELGEKNFQEKNKINFSRKDFSPRHFIEKIGKHITKSLWISKEEKDVIKAVRRGEIKPDEQTLKQLTERMLDMGLDITNKNNMLTINFIPSNENMSEEEKDIVKKYNQQATIYAKMPDLWKNRQASLKKEYQSFMRTGFYYEEQKNKLLKLLAKSYEEHGLSQEEAGKKSMLNMKDADYKIAMLQFTNTNPNMAEELKEIEKEDSWKRLLNNENLWKGFYMGLGYGARKGLTFAFGLVAAPLVSGAIGGIRARKKAGQKIDATFKSGREEKTFREREAGNRSGFFNDKNKQGIISKTLSGKQVSTKEVAAFVDADSQIHRLDNLLTKMEGAKNPKEKSRVASHISTRIKYIEIKNKEGLINYGTKNAIATNYKLLELTSRLSFLIKDSLPEKLEEIDSNEIKKEISDRNELLDQIMRKNRKRFGKKQAQIKNREMLRGIVISASFSLLGWKIRDLMEHGGGETLLTNHNINTEKAGTYIKNATSTLKTNTPSLNHEHLKEVHQILHSKPINPIQEKTVSLDNYKVATLIKPRVEAIADHGQGAISTLRELQRNLRAEYGNNLENAPTSVKHILNTNADKLAREYGMYKPGQGAESAFIKSGSSFQVDRYGNVTYHPEGGNSSVILEKGTAVKVDNAYKGKMFDSDHSAKITKTVNPNQGKTVNFDNHKMPPKSGIADKTMINIPKHAPIEQTLAGSKSSVIEVRGTQLSPEEYKSSLVTKHISKHVMKRMQRIYENNINKMFPSSKSLAAWNSIKNSTGDYSAEKLVNWNQPTNNTYKTLISEMKKLHKITGLKPWGKSILHPAETPEEYIVRTSRKVAETGKLHKLKL